MIQDIAPHKYDNCYRSQKPQDSDYALYIKENKALLTAGTYTDDSKTAVTESSLSEKEEQPEEPRQQEKEEQRPKQEQLEKERLRIPTIGELKEYFPAIWDHACYLFSIDDKAYFLIEDSENCHVDENSHADENCHVDENCHADENCRGDAEVPSCMIWQGAQYFRQMEPMYQGFAAITAMQLWRWKESRRFCGRCGCPAIHSETERALVCPKCGQIEYPKISPAVIVAITNGDKLLMSRYRDRPYGGYALIAGFVEIGESFEETVHREVMEEVGLRVKNVRYYKSQPWAFSDTEMIGFFAELDGDDTIVLQDDELSEAGWYSKDEIADDMLSISVGSEMKMVFKYNMASVV